MQRTIYVKDEDWDRVKEIAADRNKSISEVLVSQFRNNWPEIEDIGKSPLDRIEQKIDLLICFFNDRDTTGKFKDKPTDSPKFDDPRERLIDDNTSKVFKKEPEKIMGYSKEQQLGKRK